MKWWWLLILLVVPGAWEATVFLVLLEGGGQAGKAVGCGDSLLPFAVGPATGRLRPAVVPEESFNAPVALKDAPREAVRRALVRAAVNALLAELPAIAAAQLRGRLGQTPQRHRPLGTAPGAA